MFRLLLLLMTVRHSSSNFDSELHAKYLELPYDQFIQHFNAQNYSWKIKHYPHLNHREQFGPQLPSGRTEDIEVIHHDPETIAQLPIQFDARDKWPNCKSIKAVYDKGIDCESGCAIGVATVTSDRTCIHKGLNVLLSEQDFNCFHHFPNICYGGEPFFNFVYWLVNGLVTQECKPYNITESKLTDNCVEVCKDPNVNYTSDKHYGDRMYFVPENDTEEIMAELVENGPVLALFYKYEDFNSYANGIYGYKYGVNATYSVIRVIGYGEERGVGYWLATNVLGTDWGEKGLIRIKRNQPELLFEANMISGFPK